MNTLIELNTTFNFTWKEGQTWVVLGDDEPAKKDFFDTLSGKKIIHSGTIKYPFAESYLNNTPIGEYRRVSDLISYISFRHHFRNKSNTNQFYYQQRFNSFEIEDSIKVLDYMKSITSKISGQWTIDRVVDRLFLTDLVDKPMISLSNGETRRLMFAAALLKNPKIALIEHPFVGLDQSTRKAFDLLFTEIVDSGIHLIVSSDRREIPSVVNNAIVFDKESMPIQTSIDKLNLNKIKSEHTDKKKINNDNINLLLKDKEAINYNTIVVMNNVNIRYGSKQILEGINWEIKPGERWNLRGPNGAGKSTLLSLINGDNPQAYANDIVLFDRKRGSGESIWDIKKKIGYVSPEFFQFFPTQQSCLDIVCSGFFDTLGLFRKCNKKQTETAMRWLEATGLAAEVNTKFNKLTVSQQRICLITRALVKNPPLLILDEPCQGLSTEQKDNLKQLVNQICASGDITLIYVSHYPDDIPDCVNKSLSLENGKVVASD